MAMRLARRGNELSGVVFAIDRILRNDYIFLLLSYSISMTIFLR